MPKALRWLLVVGLAGGLGAGMAHAWSGHALCSLQALRPMPELSGVQVRAESLEHFLADQAPRLETLLAEQETWARANLDVYPARPDALAFRASDTATPVRLRFLRALRLNELSRLTLFIQRPPGQAEGAGPRMPWVDITALRSGVAARENTYLQIAEGATVAAIDVVATASSEPDYGLDIGLYTDSGTPQGQAYGFGKQPFGDAKLDYSSQAPFHMGFYHEAGIVYAAGGFLRRTHPESRIALFSALSRHAFATGHEYWGWRFAGWAMHYVQDLTQPYHSRVLPGVSAARMIAINTLAMAGIERFKLDAIALVSNRHTVVENFQYRRVTQAFRDGRDDDTLFLALRDTRSDKANWLYPLSATRAVVTQEAVDAADELDAQLERSFPPRYTADPTVSLGMEGDRLDMPAIARQHSAAEYARLDALVAARLARMGVHSRALVREILRKPTGS